jgi:hypothetical protein
MTKFVVFLPVLSGVLASCGSNAGTEGANVLTPRFDDGVFSLIECKGVNGEKGLSLAMTIQFDTITEIKVMKGKTLFETYDFVAASERDSDEGIFVDVELAKREGLQMAFARWNLEQGVLLLDRPNEEILSGSACELRNKRVWESLSGVSSGD